jgi:transporter family-2 protein
MLGFGIVLGFPLAFSKAGALVVMMGVIAGQILTGILWDTLVDGKTVSWNQIIGALLVVGGTLLTMLK